MDISQSGNQATTNENASSSSNSSVMAEQSQILSQLGMFITLQEDIQCRYSLACHRLESLLAALDIPQNNSGHTQYYLRKGKKNDEDPKILQAYNDCIQLQLQLNLAQRAIERLQRALGIRVSQVPANPNVGNLLRQTSTDKLRVITELLLDSLLSMTNPSTSIPKLPLSLYKMLDPARCEELFRNVCISGTRQMQINAGALLVRVCGTQGWWGDFLGSMLQEFFSAEQHLIFPQDRSVKTLSLSLFFQFCYMFLFRDQRVMIIKRTCQGF